MRFGVFLFAALLFGQDRSPDLRTSVTLAQVDAVVTDQRGRQVSDLSADDFQLFENGARQKITYFAYVRSQPVAGTASATQAAGQKHGALQREQVRRTIALVVDDLKMSFPSMARTREMLHKFLEEQLAPGDLVAIIPTSGGSGALQQFTADRKLLHAAVARLRFKLGGTGQAGSTRSLNGLETSDEEAGEIARVLYRRFAVGTMGTVKFVTSAMRNLPGRKSLVLIADGLPPLVSSKRGEAPMTLDEVKRVSDNANRSAVVIYGIDPRGLLSNWLQAADDTQGLEADQVNDAIRGREAKFLDSQQSLRFLAGETGGFAQFNNNDLNSGLAKVMDDQSGYYLLGFQPVELDAARIRKEGKYHRLIVNVARAELRVRFRKEYMGDTGLDAQTSPPKGDRLLAALNSPFAESGIKLRFTPMFIYEQKGQTAARALLHVDGTKITYGAPDSDGFVEAKLRIVAITEADDAAAGRVTGRIFTSRVKTGELEEVRRRGFLCTLRHPVKRPGAFQMRVAVQDLASGAVGSSSEFIEIPDMGKSAPGISSILMGDGDWRTQPKEGASAQQDLSPAIRLFRRGHVFSYSVTVYNAQPDARLLTRLFRGDEVIWEGKPIPVRLDGASDPTRVPIGGVLNLGEPTAAGDYILEVRLANTKRTVASQRIDFELQ